MPDSNQPSARAVYGEKTASMLVTPIPASILRHLAECERSLGELARELGLSKSRIAYHLAQLEKAGLIKKTREEVYHGGIRKFYRATSSLQLPHLDDLRGAQREAQLLPIKTFLWGYLLGRMEPPNSGPDKATISQVNQYTLEIAEALEKTIAKGDQVDDESGELLYLKLLLRVAKNRVEQKQAEANAASTNTPLILGAAILASQWSSFPNDSSLLAYKILFLGGFLASLLAIYYITRVHESRIQPVLGDSHLPPRRHLTRPSS